MADVPIRDDDRRYASMEDAFRDKRTSLDNQRFIRRLLEGIDVEGVYAYSDHFRVARRDGGPWLEVHHGSTNGFVSAEEIRNAVPYAAALPSSARPGTWRVEHPDRAPDREVSGISRRQRRAGGTCPECRDVLPVSGVCNNPDCSMSGIAD